MTKTPVITRFAPSPTGLLHIGGARTALFNWLFARHHGGEFRLRIEDTDRERSTSEAVGAILDGMHWLGLDYDGDAVYQFARAKRHREVAQQLLDAGKAYKCYCSKEELDAMRKDAEIKKLPLRYNGKWRDKDHTEAPEGADYVVRLKTPLDGDTIIDDKVQGRVTVANNTIDDMVLLRSDGTPTYMLAVVVDDHDMGVTHVIRGDDHFTNAFRQKQIYDAMEWEVPVMVHIPLIHGSDGAKLSKRHGALGVDAYRKMGFLPEALRNYLLRLGWGHGDDEIISTEQAVEWFDLDGLGKSAARFDIEKAMHVNGVYIKNSPNDTLAKAIYKLLEAKLGAALDEVQKGRVERGMEGLKQRAKNLVELTDSASFYVLDRPQEITEKAQKILDESIELLPKIVNRLEAIDGGNWRAEVIEEHMRDFCESEEHKLGKVMGVIRAAITGSHMSPSMFEVLVVFGKEAALKRLKY